MNIVINIFEEKKVVKGILIENTRILHRIILLALIVEKVSFSKAAFMYICLKDIILGIILLEKMVELNLKKKKYHYNVKIVTKPFLLGVI